MYEELALATYLICLWRKEAKAEVNSQCHSELHDEANLRQEQLHDGTSSLVESQRNIFVPKSTSDGTCSCANTLPTRKHVNENEPTATGLRAVVPSDKAPDVHAQASSKNTFHQFTHNDSSCGTANDSFPFANSTSKFPNVSRPSSEVSESSSTSRVPSQTIVSDRDDKETHNLSHIDGGTATEAKDAQSSRISSKANKSSPYFVDLGCGNGFLTYLLTSEGFNGCGIDLQKRDIWDKYDVEVDLRQLTVDPSSLTFPEAGLCFYLF